MRQNLLKWLLRYGTRTHPIVIVFYGAIAIGLSACGEHEELKKIDGKLGVVLQQTTSLSMESLSSEKTVYGLWDDEHKKLIGLLKNAPALQVGNAIVWDDDVYEVKLLRYTARKSSETNLDDANKTPVRSSGDMHVIVQFVGKLTK